MSMKASVFSLSKSLKDGISPALSCAVSHQGSWGRYEPVPCNVMALEPRGTSHTLDDLAEDTGCHSAGH